jgi:hypothetical protein
MSAAADAEDQTEKSVVTPGPLMPARELYGAMLLQSGMAKEAMAAFEATLEKEPNRLGATIGAAKAAEKAGDAGPGDIAPGGWVGVGLRPGQAGACGRARVPRQELTLHLVASRQRWRLRGPADSAGPVHVAGARSRTCHRKPRGIETF